MTRAKRTVGTVIQFALPNGTFAYGRVLEDASVAFYATISAEPGNPPIGERRYQFTVGVYDAVFRSRDVVKVGNDPSTGVDEDWPPPYSVRDPITGRMSTYHHGSFRPATDEEAEELEPAAVWNLEHLVDRLMRTTR